MKKNDYFIKNVEMKKDDGFIKYVKRWLISHYSEFTYKPYIVKKKYINRYYVRERYYKRDLKYKEMYILKFSSIPNIEVIIDSYGKFDLVYKLKYKGEEYFANPLDLFTDIKKNHKGFYCDLCIEKTYYRNKEEVWENHLEEFITWSKEKLKKGSKFMIRNEDTFFDLVIVPEDFDIDNEEHYKHIPFRFKKYPDYIYTFLPIEGYEI